MRLCFIPFEASSDDSASEHRLSEADSARGGRVKTAKRVEWVSLDFGAYDGFIYETQIEMCVVSNQYRSTTAVVTNGSPHLAENTL